MSSLIEINDSQSERLNKIASEKGVMPNLLIEEALELLFQQTERELGLRAERAYLSELEAEGDGSLEIQTRAPFKRGEFKITHSVPVKADALRPAAR